MKRISKLNLGTIPKSNHVFNLSTFYYADLPPDEEKKYYVDVNQPMKTGYTPLHLAVMYGSKEMTQCLLQCTPLVTER